VLAQFTEQGICAIIGKLPRAMLPVLSLEEVK